MVTGRLPLPDELAVSRPAGNRTGYHAETEDLAQILPTLSVLRAHTGPDFIVRPVVVTWDFTVLEAVAPNRTAYVCIPGSSMPVFAGLLEGGALDQVISGYLALPSRRKILASSRQTGRPGLYDQCATSSLGQPSARLR